MINLAEHYNLDLFTFLVEALEKLLTKIKYYNHCTVHVRLLYIKLLTSSHNTCSCMHGLYKTFWRIFHVQLEVHKVHDAINKEKVAVRIKQNMLTNIT
jgi:hypothetical protein